MFGHRRWNRVIHTLFLRRVLPAHRWVCSYPAGLFCRQVTSPEPMGRQRLHWRRPRPPSLLPPHWPRAQAWRRRRVSVRRRQRIKERNRSKFNQRRLRKHHHKPSTNQRVWKPRPWDDRGRSARCQTSPCGALTPDGDEEEEEEAEEEEKKELEELESVCEVQRVHTQTGSETGGERRRFCRTAIFLSFHCSASCRSDTSWQ